MCTLSKIMVQIPINTINSDIFENYTINKTLQLDKHVNLQ